MPGKAVRMAGITGLLTASVGCSAGGDKIDPFPVPVDFTAGPALITASSGDPAIEFPVVLDTLSPITVVDSFVPGEPEPSPRRRTLDLSLLATGAGSPVPRIFFNDVSAFDVHPCVGVDSFCGVGLDNDRRDVRGIIGADVLARGAVRFDYPASAVRFFPDIAGDASSRGKACESVLDSPFAGGGTLVLAGAEFTFAGRRIALGTCMHFDPLEQDDAARGTPALLVLSTALGATILSRTTYERYRILVDDAAIAPAVDTLPDDVLHLTSGPVEVKRGNVSRIAVVGEGSANRGPCQEMFANHVMSDDLCRDADAGIVSCPCQDNKKFCSTGAVVELAASFDVAIVDDLHPLLQALRDELRPALPEVDGILGNNALAPIELDIDYPHNRLVVRCGTDVDCIARPAVRSRNTIEVIDNCPSVP